MATTNDNVAKYLVLVDHCLKDRAIAETVGIVKDCMGLRISCAKFRVM